MTEHILFAAHLLGCAWPCGLLWHCLALSNAASCCVQKGKHTCQDFVTNSEIDNLQSNSSFASLCCVYDAAGVHFYANVPERLHITVFHTSQFDDTRPNPLKPLRSDEQERNPAQRMRPTTADLQQEQEMVQTIVSQTQALALEVAAVHHTHYTLYKTHHSCMVIASI